MTEKRRKTPYEQGIRVFFGKKYIWLLNHKGNLELHSLDRPVPKDRRPVDE